MPKRESHTITALRKRLADSQATVLWQDREIEQLRGQLRDVREAFELERDTLATLAELALSRLSPEKQRSVIMAYATHVTGQLQTMGCMAIAASKD